MGLEYTVFFLMVMGGMVIYYSIPDRSMGDGRTLYDYNKFHIYVL